ncbi:thermonuclease family protein [Bdellovibrio sp. 22V]|uniref:thermonuclease family protein n=1 Tax=Bdellovibrio TaxID=958 RepID=UPI0025429B40|nr:thermonuclease family protein [Bdellovibrio sp. 22V]WII71532.1 thermonuclease family protein [Bdellovibrio sp. 22V]
MFKHLGVSVCLLVFVSCFQAFGKEASCRHDEKVFRCVEVVNNYDGDTLTVNIPHVPALIGKNISVRVSGIDTPEIKTKNQCEKNAGRIARNLVSATLKKAKSVELHNVQRDKYFRILADVIVDGQSLKDILLKNNLAYAYDGGTKKHPDWCKVLRSPANH